YRVSVAISSTSRGSLANAAHQDRQQSEKRERKSGAHVLNHLGILPWVISSPLMLSRSILTILRSISAWNLFFTSSTARALPPKIAPSVNASTNIPHVRTNYDISIDK